MFLKSKIISYTYSDGHKTIEVPKHVPIPNIGDVFMVYGENFDVGPAVVTERQIFVCKDGSLIINIGCKK